MLAWPYYFTLLYYYMNGAYTKLVNRIVRNSLDKAMKICCSDERSTEHLDLTRIMFVTVHV